MAGKAEAGVVINGFGGGEEDEGGCGGGFAGVADEFAADALALMGGADGQIRQVSAIVCIG